MSLRPCPGCTRHVRASESACPFCASALPACDERPVDEASTARPSSRHALMFGVAAGAIAVSTALFGTACAMYGAPAPERDAGTPTDSGAGR
jgi:hypothetical protein